ncbi:hypothetical protein ACIP5N_21210 [Streptomyces sp. NPDC088768]|uniref:hypothetical protein n=1 Tax=Streptomyces sp. NPDC088768 TaxID=3365894 RepID=UPI0038289AB6
MKISTTLLSAAGTAAAAALGAGAALALAALFHGSAAERRHQEAQEEVQYRHRETLELLDALTELARVSVLLNSPESLLALAGGREVDEVRVDLVGGQWIRDLSRRWERGALGADDLAEEAAALFRVPGFRACWARAHFAHERLATTSATQRHFIKILDTALRDAAASDHAA